MSSPLSPSDAFETRRSGFEAEYFHKKDAQMVEKLKAVFNRKLDREELQKATGITNTEVIDRLLAVNAKGELLLVFRLYPLVEMAWADGNADPRECKAVIDAAIRHGVPAGSAAIKTLEDWLKRGPTADGRTAWYAFAGELRKILSPDELNTFRTDLLEGAQAVAKASGGILGMAFEVSGGERKVLDAITRSLTHA
jgi:hypothetical protein